MSVNHNHNVRALTTAQELVASISLPEARMVVIKAGAPWCAPCRACNPAWQEGAQRLARLGAVCFDICVDDSIDLYAVLKRKRIVSKLPSFAAFLHSPGCAEIPAADIVCVGAGDLQSFIAGCEARLTGQ